MGRERGPDKPVSEENYEVAHLPTLIERIIVHKRKQSIQDTLEALANEGYYAVKERDGK